MKSTSILSAIIAMAVTCAATPGPLPMGVEIVERDGQTFVREVVSQSAMLPIFMSSCGSSRITASCNVQPHQLLGRGIEARCRNCVGQGGRCTIGDGSCYSENPPMYCTWCGDRCKSVCVRSGQRCPRGC
ncbi:hypothetical protein CP533_2367 [Ophiocordyceps camponoti-saundersi (nom. inval.)]|nr:hypothetical protein CP533_2367 [Ophiocordyceps camponoti-saundersi (nom. inval.)]